MDVVTQTGLVIEVKRYTCSISKATRQLMSYCAGTWVNEEDVFSKVTPFDAKKLKITAKIEGDFEFEGKTVYYSDIGHGFVLYDYSDPGDLDSLKKNVGRIGLEYRQRLNRGFELSAAAIAALGAAAAQSFIRGNASKMLKTHFDDLVCPGGYNIR